MTLSRISTHRRSTNRFGHHSGRHDYSCRSGHQTRRL